jgi:class 3 adenylate cyclase/tetratricopeptide (TPR) repeat protein
MGGEAPPSKQPTLDQKLIKIQKSLPKDSGQIILEQGDSGGERRLVTIMLCDMKGSTPLTHKLGPEKTFGLMEKILQIMVLKVYHYQGTVNDIRGDGILGLFGALDAPEDAPQRAIRSSMAIHKEIAEFSGRICRELQISPILLRIGISTGTVVIRTIHIDGRFRFNLVGDPINMAARIEALAEPGTTNVTEETYRLTKDLFHFQPLGRKMVKGKDQPISVYRVLSPKEDVYRPRLGSERLIYSRMVGRDEELHRLEVQVMEAIKGRGSVVNVIGEAGIGKSRLIAELKRREVMKRVILLEGRAISIGKNLSFHPIVDLFKQWAGIHYDDGEKEAFIKLREVIKGIFGKADEEILPFLAILLGMKLTGVHARRTEGIEGEALNRLILKSIKDLLVRATEQTPLVIVNEDLHWADQSSIDLLESLFRLVETCRIVFINLFRPGYQETGDRLAKTLKQSPNKRPMDYVEVVLEPLSENMSQALICDMLPLPEFKHSLGTSIVERTGGNPFFIEEVVRSLIDEQVIIPRGGKFQLTRKATNISIPNTIEALLMARIDRLEEKTRDLVKEASVIGRSFFYRVLIEVASKIGNIDKELSYLEEIQILRERLRRGELEYLFKHALTQEVAYESILPLKRRELHLKVAKAIETVFNEKLNEFYGMLAFHYCKAESLEEAEDCLIKAGEEALRSAASDEAIHYYTEALDLYLKKSGKNADPEKVAMLEKNIGLALFNRGRYKEAVDHFDKALNYYWGELPKTALPQLLKFLLSLLKFLLALYIPSRWFKRLPTKRDIEAVDLLYKKVEALAIINPKRFFIESVFTCGTIVHFDLSKFRSGIATFVGASGIFSFTGFSPRLAEKILNYAKPLLAKDDAKQWILYDMFDTLCHLLKGEWSEITECNKDLVNRNLRVGEMWYSSQHYYWHGLPKIYQGDFDAVKTIATELNEIAETYDNDIYRLLKFLLNLHLLIESRRLEEAAEEADRGIELVERNWSAVSALSMYSLKAFIQLLMKETEEAGKSLEKANQVKSEVNATPIQLSFFYRSNFQYYLNQLEDCLMSGSKEFSEYRENAYKSGKKLIKTCEKAALLRTESYRLMGIFNWLIDDQKGALKWWDKAISEGERIGARPQMARTYAEMGKRFYNFESKSMTPDVKRAKEYIQKAQTMFNDLNLRQDRVDLDSVINRSGIGPLKV